jgi:hypothetical protein
MTDAGPLLRSRRLWAEREKRCIATLERALLLLRLNHDVPETEVELNRCLYFCLLAASRELYPKDDIAPIPECNNQPDPDDEARAVRDGKRPDFQWIYLDRYEPDPHYSSKQFVVECKRLGKPSRADWVFNLNYVYHGINRFRDAIWAYAQRFPSGAMVGYWQSMEGEQVLNEVNAESRKNSLPDLILIRWSFGAVTRLEHHFDRPVEASPFRLHHLWIDLRDRGQRKLSKSAR